ncbi:MAG: hypothetical protein KDI16_01340 [Halioglobus sp.]|nr:hypothetical protein [Halioglobus sp.]
MGETLDFPTQRARGLAYLERQLRALLAAKGADAELIDFAVEQLTGTYARLRDAEQYSFSIELPAGIDPDERDRLHRQISAGLQSIRDENHALLVQLAARLVLAELRLFQHERT